MFGGELHPFVIHFAVGLLLIAPICDVLGLDADYLRRGLHAAKAQAAESQHGKVVTIHTDRRDELRKASGD